MSIKHWLQRLAAAGVCKLAMIVWLALLAQYVLVTPATKHRGPGQGESFRGLANSGLADPHN